MQTVDLTHIPARHDAINIRLEQWARWVTVRPQPWKMASIWRNYRAPRQYSYETADIPVPINGLEALEIERGVSFLPEKHRDVIRWFYVFHWIHPGVMQRRLGLTQDGICKLLDDSRDMLKNRMREKLVDNHNSSMV